ncbi:Acylase OS=Streptomyces alboniger OX=132473 GN=CP975_32690 PE=3 SV=1 [Streptomyces alboniger]
MIELRAAGIALDSRLGEHQFVVRDGRADPRSGRHRGAGCVEQGGARVGPGGGGYTEVTTGSSYIQAVGWDGGRARWHRTADDVDALGPS